MVSSTFHQIQNIFLNWNVLYAVLFEKQMYNSGNFNGKNRWIIKKVTVLKKLLPHLATRGTYSPGDWRCDEAWHEQTLVYPPVMCQQRLSYCTWELNVMRVTVKFDWWPCKTIGHLFYATLSFVHHLVAIGEYKLELQSGNAHPIWVKFDDF